MLVIRLDVGVDLVLVVEVVGQRLMDVREGEAGVVRSDLVRALPAPLVAAHDVLDGDAVSGNAGFAAARAGRADDPAPACLFGRRWLSGVRSLSSARCFHT